MFLVSALLFVCMFQSVLAVKCVNGCIDLDGCSPQEDPCNADYCIYIREISIQPFVNSSTLKRTCSAYGQILYHPNYPAYSLMNTCSSIVIDNVDYHLQICNYKDYCNHDCYNPQPFNPYSSPTYVPPPSTSSSTYHPPPTTPNSAIITTNVMVLLFFILITLNGIF